MARRIGPTRPVPPLRPNPKLDCWVKGPPAHPLETLMLQAVSVLALIAVAAACVASIASRTCGIGTVC